MHQDVKRRKNRPTSCWERGRGKGSTGQLLVIAHDQQKEKAYSKMIIFTTGGGRISSSAKGGGCHREGFLTVSNLVAWFDVGLGVNDDLLDAVDRDDPRRAVGNTAVVDQTSVRSHRRDQRPRKRAARKARRTQDCPSSSHRRRDPRRLGTNNYSQCLGARRPSLAYPRLAAE